MVILGFFGNDPNTQYDTVLYTIVRNCGASACQSSQPNLFRNPSAHPANQKFERN